MRFDIEFAIKEQGTKISEIEKNLTKLSSTSQTSQKNINNFTSSIKSMTAAFIGYVAASKALDVGTSLSKSIIETTASFEKYLTMLKTFEGSEEKAAASFEYIKKFAKETPFELDKVTEAFIKLRSYGLDTTGLKIYGDTAAAMGKDINQVIEAMADAGVNQYERLLEFGVKSSNLGKQTIFAYTDASGKSKTIIAENNKEIIESTLQAIFNSKYNGAMNDLSQTYNGMLSNLSDNWTQLQNKIGQESGVFDSIKNAISVINKEFNSISPNTDAIKSFGDTVKAVIIGTIKSFEVLSLFITNFSRGINTISFAFETAFNAVEVVFARTKLFILNGLKGVAQQLADTFSFLPESANKYKSAVINIEKAILAEKENANKKTHSIAEEQKRDVNEYIKTERKRLELEKSISNASDIISAAFENNTNIQKSNNAESEKSSKNLANIGNEGILAKSKIGSLNDAVKDLKKSQDLLKNTDLIEYFNLIGESAKSAELELYNKIGELAEKGTLNPDQLTSIYQAQNKKIIELKAQETEQKLQKDVDYYRFVNDLNNAFLAESEQIKQQLIQKGYTAAEVEKLHAIEVNKLSKEYGELALQMNDLKNQDLSEYFKSIGKEAEAAKLELEQKMGQLKLGGNLSESQLSSIYEAEQKKIVQLEAQSTEQKLAFNKNYYMAIKDFESARLLEEQEIKQNLISQGYEGIQLEEMHIAKVKELAETYNQLNIQELENQKTVKAGFELYMKSLSDSVNDYNTLTQNIMYDIESSLGNSFNTFFKKGEEGFLNLKTLSKNVFQGILESIQQAITQMIVMQTMQAVMGGMSGGLGGLFAKGAAFSNGSVQAFATGGVVSSPTFFGMSNNKTGLMGEAGPEAIMPLQRDSGGNLGVKSTAPVVNINNYAGANVVAKQTENGYNIDIESIDRQLADRARSGRSEYDKISQKKYGLSKV